MTLPEKGAEGRGLARRLGLFDATMIVMGGIVGSGIFMEFLSCHGSRFTAL